MKELMISLLLWIGTNSTLMVENVILPQVKFTSSEEMHRIFGMEDSCGDTTVKALYDIHNKEIYLLDDWDKSNLIDRSFYHLHILHYQIDFHRCVLIHNYALQYIGHHRQKCLYLTYY